MRNPLRTGTLTLLCCVAIGATLSAQECGPCASPAARSGFGGQVAPWAKPTFSSNHVHSYVGGGALCGGGPRQASEGTWGRDYTAGLGFRRIFLGWGRDRFYQGGAGTYGTDGLRVNNVLTLTPILDPKAKKH